MTNEDKGLALLPNGFMDLLPPHAEAEAGSIHTLMQKFMSFGYERIKPPLLEFEDSLLAPGPGERLSSDTFRLMDPVSHRMLGVRSDITPQIARIAASRLGGEPRPLRLTYANDVLRIQGNQLRTERQFCQVGCELIGDGSGVHGAIEICVLSILGLKALGIKDITIDLTIPNFVSRLLAGVRDGDTCLVIQKAVAQRDRDALAKIEIPQARKIVLSMEASGAYERALEILSDIKLDAEITQDIVDLADICKGIKNALADLSIDDVSMTIDVLEQVGFEYHKAMGFTLFSKNVHGELGRGGCYDVRFGQKGAGETAKGFTLYMDTIRKACNIPAEKKKVSVSLGEDWSVIDALQKQGWIVVRCGNDGLSSPCTHKYENGTIIEVNKQGA